MLRHSTLLALACAFGSVANAAPILDGAQDVDYGAPLAVQSVATGFAGNELNAAYATVQSGTLYLMLTGTLTSNFNRLNIFIDSQAGGQNVLENDANFGGTNPENDGWAGPHAGMTFDSGFEADYLLILRNGTNGGDRFDVDFAVIGGGLGAFEAAGNVFGGSLTGSNGAALVNGIGVAFDDSNAGDTGIELAIPLSEIGDPAGALRISAMINNVDHNFLSNQFLGALPAGQGNLGGDGNAGFTGTLAGIDLNDFAGNQYFTVGSTRRVPEPASLALLGIGLAGLGFARRLASGRGQSML